MGWGERIRSRPTLDELEEEADHLRALTAHLAQRARELEKERDHWKANHDNQVRLKRESQQRVRYCIEDLHLARDAMHQAGLTPPLSRLLDF